MWRKKLLIVVLISILILVGCKSNDGSEEKSENIQNTSGVTVEDTTDVTADNITEEDITLCYWDIADMKNRLPKKMIIDEVVIDEDKIATVNVTLDEKDRGNYTTSAWAVAMENTILHTLIENENFGIDKVVFGATLNEITTFVDNIYFEIIDGEVVSADVQ